MCVTNFLEWHFSFTLCECVAEHAVDEMRKRDGIFMVRFQSEKRKDDFD